MDNFLIVSHGEYAKATLASCEMIAGKLSNVKAIAFKQTMNQDDLLDEISQTAESFEQVPTIIVDMLEALQRMLHYATNRLILR